MSGILPCFSPSFLFFPSFAVAQRPFSRVAAEIGGPPGISIPFWFRFDSISIPLRFNFDFVLIWSWDFSFCHQQIQISNHPPTWLLIYSQSWIKRGLSVHVRGRAFEWLCKCMYVRHCACTCLIVSFRMSVRVCGGYDWHLASAKKTVIVYST